MGNPLSLGKLKRTLFRAYTTQLKSIKDLIIKGTEENEGTTKYSRFVLKESMTSKMTVGTKLFEIRNMGVNIYDTRGQIWLNEKEEAELDALVQVGLKG